MRNSMHRHGSLQSHSVPDMPDRGGPSSYHDAAPARMNCRQRVDPVLIDDIGWKTPPPTPKTKEKIRPPPPLPPPPPEPNRPFRRSSTLPAIDKRATFNRRGTMGNLSPSRRSSMSRSSSMAMMSRENRLSHENDTSSPESSKKLRRRYLREVDAFQARLKPKTPVVFAEHSAEDDSEDRKQWFRTAFSMLERNPNSRPPTQGFAEPSRLPRTYEPLLTDKGGAPGESVIDHSHAEFQPARPIILRKPEVIMAAGRYDSRHSKLKTQVTRLHSKVFGDPTSSSMQSAFGEAVTELGRMRYVVKPWDPMTADAEMLKYVQSLPPREKSKRKKDHLRIWAGRNTWSDGKALLDTDEVRQKRFLADFGRSVEQNNVAKIIVRNDDNGGGMAALNAEGLPEEVVDVRDVLESAHATLNVLFNFYAAQHGDFRAMTLNEWTDFIGDFNLSSKHSKYCKPRDMDNLFLEIKASSANYWRDLAREIAKRPPDPKGQKGPQLPDAEITKSKSLFRHEFMSALVYLAIKKYVATGEMPDVSDALYRLLFEDVQPEVDKKPEYADPNHFRTEHLYTEAVCGVLEMHELAMRPLFGAVAGLDGAGGGTGREAKLISYAEWRDFLTILQFIGADLTERDARLAFVWSRMAVIDGLSPSGQLKDTSLPFEGFMEALCRLAFLKALPTDREINEAYSKPDHAGQYMYRLKADETAKYEALLIQRRGVWGVPQERQPAARCVDHLFAIVLHTVDTHPAAKELRRLVSAAKDAAVKEAAAPRGAPGGAWNKVRGGGTKSKLAAVSAVNKATKR